MSATREKSEQELLKQHFIQHGFADFLVDALYLGYCNHRNVAYCANNWLAEHPVKPESSAWVKHFSSEVHKILTQPDISQNNITKKLLSVFTKYFPRNAAVIAALNLSGACDGFSILVSYALMLDLSQKRTKINGVFKPRDDWTWLKSTFNFFACWDEVSDLPPQKIADAVYLVSVINMIQNIRNYLCGTHQGDCAEFFEDTRNRSLTLRYAIGGLFTQEETQKLVIEQIFWQMKKVILANDNIYDAQFALVSSHGHDTSIIQRYLSFQYYDPNNITGPISVAKEDVSFLIFVANYFSNIPSPLGFRLYGVGYDKQARYPAHEKVLQQTQVIKDKKYNDFRLYGNGRTVIDVASFIGSQESLHYFFSAGATFYNSYHWLRLTTIDEFLALPQFLFRLDVIGDYAIHSAVKTNQLLMIEKILKKDKRVAQLVNILGSTALHIAIEQHFVAVIQLLLFYDADVTLKNANWKTALQLAEEQGGALYFPQMKDKTFGQEALIKACRNNDVARVKLLLLTGVNPLTQTSTRLPVDRLTQNAAIKALLLAESKKHAPVSQVGRFKKTEGVRVLAIESLAIESNVKKMRIK